MHPEALAFLNTQRVCVFAIEMMDGSPHAAAVHIAHVAEPLTFIILTSPNSRKGQTLFGRDETRASIVIGFSEGSDSKSLQMDGVVRQLTDMEKSLKDVYVAKFPESPKKFPNDSFVAFTPTWWRFSDWSKPEGKTIYLSDGTVEFSPKAATPSMRG